MSADINDKDKLEGPEIPLGFDQFIQDLLNSPEVADILASMSREYAPQLSASGPVRAEELGEMSQGLEEIDGVAVPVCTLRPEVIIGSYPSNPTSINKDYEPKDLRPIPSDLLRREVRLQVPSNSVALAENGLSSVYRDRESDRLKIGFYGQYERCRDARLVTVEAPPNLNDLPPLSPFEAKDGRIPIPIFGHLYLGGSGITEVGEEKLGISEFVLDGKPLTVPVWVSGFRSLIVYGKSTLLGEKQGEHGIRFLTNKELQDKDYIESLREQNLLKEIPVNGWQWTGVGIERYFCHSVMKAPGCSKEFTNGDIMLQSDSKDPKSRGYSVQRQEYAGASGILLDQKYQSVSLDPTGGLRAGSPEAERDRRLWARDSDIMGGFTVGEIPLISKEKLAEIDPRADRMLVDKLAIKVRTLTDNSARMSIFQGRHLIEPTLTDPMKMFLEAHVNTGSLKLSGNTYLYLVAERIGRACRVTLEEGLTIPADQESNSNFTVWGQILDTDNLTDLKTPFQAINLISNWLSVVVNCNSALGESRAEFYKGLGIRSFLTGLFPDTATTDAFYEKIANLDNEMGISLVIGCQAVKEILNQRHLYIDEGDLREYSKQNAEFHQHLADKNLDENSDWPTLHDAYINFAMVNSFIRSQSVHSTSTSETEPTVQLLQLRSR